MAHQEWSRMAMQQELWVIWKPADLQGEKLRMAIILMGPLAIDQHGK